MPDQFYRYEWTQYASLDFDGDYVNPIFPNPVITESTFYMVKETPKGWWISSRKYHNKTNDRWISKTSKRRYAYPTKKEAMNNFILRTKRRIKILQWTIDSCECALSKANQINIDE